MIARSGVRRMVLIATALSVIVLPAFSAAGAGTPEARATGTIRAIVRHNDGVTRPMPGVADVEVFVYDIDTQTTYLGCTNAAGIARFLDMPTGGSYLAGTGPSCGYAPDGSNRCANGEFLNPFPGDNEGKKMFAVFWNRHKGERTLDTFGVNTGETTLLVFGTSTPLNQRKVCGGFRVTILGTTGDDNDLSGDETDNVINALGGDDFVQGGDGNDVICGGPGSDHILGGPGDDIIWGENGFDTLLGQEGFDTLYGGPQNDACGAVGEDAENVISCESSP